jgi:hypothetical protein
MKLYTGLILALWMTAPALASDLCLSAAGSVTMTELTTDEDMLQSKGTWQVSGSAAGALIEYKIDSDRYQSETQLGASGSWAITQKVDRRCGRHTLRAWVFPFVLVDKRQVHCLEQATFARQDFEVSCAPVAEILDCQWHCTGGNDGQCTGTCTGNARRGTPGYVPSWGVNGEGWSTAEAPPSGPWSQAVTCRPGQRISFKVRDRKSRWSEVDEIGCGVTE